MKLSVIIVSYNTAQLTLQCLAAVKLSLESYPGLLQDSEVIIVDNHSSDDTVSRLTSFKKLHPSLKLILLKQTKNLGFGLANNLAAAQASGEYLFFLNSDTVCQTSSIPLLLEAMITHPISQPTADLSSYRHKLDRLGIVSAQLLNPDGTNQPQGGSFPNLLSLTCHMFMLDDLPLIGRWLPSTQHTGQRQTTPQATLFQQDWVAATAMMVRASMLKEIGLFDPAIFMYGEDVELCLRARHHHWDCAVQPDAKVIHYGSASSSAKTAIIGELRGYRYIWSKHFPHWQQNWVKGILLTGCLIRQWLFGTILKDKNRAQVYQEAYQEVSAA